MKCNMIKRKVALLILFIVMFSSISFADYKKVELYRFYYNVETDMFEYLVLYDRDVDQYIKLEYSDHKKYYTQYSFSEYYYDYDKDLLLIIHQGDILYQDFDYGRKGE